MTNKNITSLFYFVALIYSFVWTTSTVDRFDSFDLQTTEIGLVLMEDTCSSEMDLFAIEEVEEGVSTNFWCNAEPTEYFSSSLITYTCLPSPCDWIGLNSPPPERFFLN